MPSCHTGDRAFTTRRPRPIQDIEALGQQVQADLAQLQGTVDFVTARDPKLFVDCGPSVRWGVAGTAARRRKCMSARNRGTGMVWWSHIPPLVPL